MSAFWWALVTAGIWGVVPVMEKIGLGQSPAVAGVLVRSLGIVIGLGVFSLCGAPWAQVKSMTWPQITLLAAGGLMASFLGQLAFYHALRNGAVSQMTPVAGAYPAVAALLGWFVLREPMTPMRVLGVVCVMLGVFLLRK